MVASVEATKVDDVHVLIEQGGVPGAYAIAADGSSIGFICPCGCGQFIRFSLCGCPNPQVHAHHPQYRHGWHFDGNFERPTIDPSIRRMDGCKYHGHLTDGQWTFCEDSGEGRDV